MASNVIPRNSLKLVKNTGDDPQAKTVTSRMGMTVGEFINTLGYPRSKAPQGNESRSRSFIWPKHTALEISDPTESVYQCGRNDISWSLRFRALGCYNLVPEKSVEHVNTLHSPCNPPNDSNNSIERSSKKSKIQQIPGELVQLQPLLSSRSIANSENNPPSETITLAERHKLLEDLRLTDSEDEDETGIVPSAAPAPSRDLPRSPVIEQNKANPALDEIVRDTNCGLLNVVNDGPVECTSARLVEPTLNFIPKSIKLPPPFVSPLSVMGDDVRPTFSHTPELGQSVELSTVVPSSQPPGDIMMECNSYITTQPSKQLNGSQPIDRFCPTPTDSSARMNSINPTSLHMSTYQDSRVSPPTDTLHDADSRLPKSRKPISRPRDVPQERKEHKDDYVRRLLLESNALLAAKERFLVKGLSPQLITADVLGHQTTVPDKENLEENTIENRTSWLTRKKVPCHKVPATPGSTLESVTNQAPPDNPTTQLPSTLRSPNVLSCEVKKSTPIFGEKGIFDEKSKSFSTDYSSRNNDKPLRRTSDRLVDEKLESMERPFAAAAAAAVVVTRPGSSPSPKELNEKNASTHLSESADSPVPLPADLPENKIPSDSVDKKHKDQEILDFPPNCEPYPSDSIETCMTVTSDKDVLQVNKLHDGGQQAGTGSEDVTEPMQGSTVDRTSMPPPTTESKRNRKSNPKQKSETPLSCNSDVKLESGTSSLEVLTGTVVPPASCSSLPKESSHVSSEPAPPNRSGQTGLTELPVAKPCTRTVPKNRWIYSDIPLTKARQKLQTVLHSATQKSSPTMLNQLRSALESICFSSGSRDVAAQPDPTSGQTRRNRARPLTGVLLIPVCREPVSALVKTSERGTPPRPKELRDAYCMTSPKPEVTDMHVQCTLLPGTPHLLSVSGPRHDSSQPREAGEISDDVELRPIGDQAVLPINGKHISLTEMNTTNGSTLDLNGFDVQQQTLSAQEEEKLQNSTVAAELRLAEECKAKASRCWKSLAISVSSGAQNGMPSSLGNRYHMFLSLEALHQYPVYLVQSVRHLLAAAHLLVVEGQTFRAADILSEAASQLEHTNRRIQRVEAKLMKRRGKHHDSQQPGTDPVKASARARRDASWMQLWYYALCRIRSIVNFRDYQLRLQLSCSLHQEIEEELIQLNKPDDLGNTISQDSTSESKSGEKQSKSNPSSDQKQSSSSNLATRSNTFPLSSSLMDRFLRLIKLDKILQQAQLDWEEADRVLSEIPVLMRSIAHSRPPVSPNSNQSTATELSLNGAPPPTSDPLDIDIAIRTVGAYLTGWQTRLGTLLRFIDGLISVHAHLLQQLKGFDSPEANSLTLTSPSVSIQEPSTYEHSDTCASRNQNAPSNCIQNEKHCEGLDSSHSRSQAEKQAATSPVTNSIKKFADLSTENSRTNSGQKTLKMNLSVPYDPSCSLSVDRKRTASNNSQTKWSSQVTSPLISPETVKTNSQSQEPVVKGKSKKAMKRRFVPCNDIATSDLFATNSTSATSTDQDSISSTPGDLKSFPGKHKNKEERLSKGFGKHFKNGDIDTPPTRYATNPPEKSRKNTDGPVLSKKQNDSRPSRPMRPVKDEEHKSRAIAMNPVQPRIRNEKRADPFPLNGLDPSPTKLNNLSPDYIPSSPSPIRSRCRSKSLAPSVRVRHAIDSSVTTHESRTGSIVKRKLGSSSRLDDVWPEDNAYQPKRIKPSTNRPNRTTSYSGSEYSDSDSSPLPSYQPSALPDLTKDKERNRRIRSCSVGRTLLRNPETPSTTNPPLGSVADGGSSAVGYSPTKHELTNGKRKKTAGAAGSLPVYHVSRISNSPNPSLNDRSSSSISSSLGVPNRPSVNSPSSSNRSSKKSVPLFYEHWIREPTPSNVPSKQAKRYENHSRNGQL